MRQDTIELLSGLEGLQSVKRDLAIGPDLIIVNNWPCLRNS